jgi:hypothetical protein
MKLNTNKLLLFVWMCVLTITISAQKVLEKPVQKWSKDEALQLLSNSPWAKTYQSTAGASSSAQQQIAREQSQSVYSGGSNPRSVARDFGPPPVTMRLHSALPIRQAIVRLQQIDVGYDKMDEKQRADFDKSRQNFLNCAICQKYYVITMTKFVDSKGQGVDEGIFQRMTLEQLKGNIWLLNEEGERRELVQFNPPKGAGDMAVFYFARADDKGNTFLTPENKKFEFVFDNTFLDSRNPYAPMLPRRFEFNISKLVANGNILF